MRRMGMRSEYLFLCWVVWRVWGWKGMWGEEEGRGGVQRPQSNELTMCAFPGTTVFRYWTNTTTRTSRSSRG